ncbi:glycosyltransferase family 2 protein [Tepidibacillus marianensis]|uniref:glycosyltransferase family 2 protein n=1 Tax=Tepidibacillus marianensis TaxID=3131995 RepID=UPI0030CC9D43
MIRKNIDLTFVVINWNSGHLLKTCIPSLLRQKDIVSEVILIDNNSSDNTREIVKNLPSDVNVILNEENFGYSAAANQGIELSNGKYVSIINPDVILTDSYGNKIIQKLENEKNVAAATGKLIKYDFKNNRSLNVLDSTGIEVQRNLRMFDRGQNSNNLTQFDDFTTVFGVSGAAPIYRRNALEDVKINDEYFDVDFFAYKEDIDLSWRFNLFGWKAIFVPSAIGYHGRAISGAGNRNKIEFIKNRKNQSSFIKTLSLKNHYSMLVKNLTIRDIKHNLLPIVIREIQHLLYSILFEFKTLKGISDFISDYKKMRTKRRLIMEKAKFRNPNVFLLNNGESLHL